MRIFRNPAVQHRKILADNRPVAPQQRIRVMKRQRGNRVVKHAAADQIIVAVRQKGAQRSFVVRGNPAHAKPRQRENLRHAADRNALVIQIDNRLAPAVDLRQIAVDLVAKDIRIDAFCDFHNLPQKRLGHQRARGIVGVVDADQLCVHIHQRPQLRQIRQVSVFLPQVHEPHVCADCLRDGIHLLIRRHNAYNAVSGRDERAEYMVIRACRAVRRNNFRRGQALIQPTHALAQRLASDDIAVGQPARAEVLQKRLPVFAAKREQLVQTHRVHARLGDIVPRAVFIGVHPFFYCKGLDVHRVAPR